ncbi:MAG: geranylgeranylglycerol-phosphate geranylgeranyltransferase [Candidatus Marinimicrobia bacterium]|jgi:geranylgeranylglycerol-phosphate geranylgeranyltransferase|nr:geranylgeranylglycerol-phosphate geranylgeranyltransferase [Candidatus Neomarinimicrobiota bacterium]
MNPFFSYINILRPLNLIFSALSVINAAYLTQSLNQTATIINAVIVVVTFAGASNILNDIFDINIDRKNQPHRPLPSGEISVWAALVYMVALYFAGIYMVFNLPELAIEIALVVVLPTLVLYTPLYKRIPLIGNMAVAAVLGMVFLFSEAAFTGTVSTMWVPAWLAFGLTFIRELVKDIEDIEGDKLDGVRTFPVIFGVEKSLYLAYLLIIIFCVLWWIPYYHNLYGNIYAMTLLFAVEIPLILSIFFLWKNPTSSGCAMISRATKWITLGGMVTILCSSL